MTAGHVRSILLFDLDGTIVLTGGAGLRAFDRTFRELFGKPGTLDGLRFHGRTDLQIIAEIFEAHFRRSPNEEEIGAFCTRYLGYLKEEVGRSTGYQVMPGIPALLETLSGREDVLVGLGTGNLEQAARIKLDRARLNHYFPFGGFGSDAADRREILRHGIARAKAIIGQPNAPCQVIVVGDTELDIASGKAVGALTVAVATGGDSMEILAAARPSCLLPDLGNPGPLLDLLSSHT